MLCRNVANSVVPELEINMRDPHDGTRSTNSISRPGEHESHSRKFAKGKRGFIYIYISMVSRGIPCFRLLGTERFKRGIVRPDPMTRKTQRREIYWLPRGIWNYYSM